METRRSLATQREGLGNSVYNTSQMVSRFPAVSRVIDAFQKKKLRDNTIVGIVISVCICFLIWWSFR